jgi:hypothetical protein
MKEGIKMYKVYGEIPTKVFETEKEAEKYIKEWEDGCESNLNTVILHEN